MQMGFLLRSALAVHHIRQVTLKLFTVHTTSPRHASSSFPSHGLAAFSALLVLRISRSFIRALCNCDLLFPIEHPTIPAISLCSKPSTSCSKKIVRYPGGNASTALMTCTPPTAPPTPGSQAPPP